MRKLLTILLVFGLLFTGTTPAYAASKGGSRSYSSSGSRSYSSSSSSKPSSSRSNSSSSSSRSSSSNSSSSSGSRSYSSSSSSKPSSSSGYSTSSSSYSKKPTQSFQSLPAAEQKKVEARQAYQKATAPKENYTTKTGEVKKIDTNDPKTKQVQDTYTQHPEKWETRKERVDSTYGNYYNRPIPTTTVIYRDHYDYNPYFWMWLADRSLDDRAYWYYHHQSDIDAQRYRDVLAKDAQLEARIKELEAKKTPHDPSYIPPGMEADVQYDEEYCDGVFNPQPKAHVSTGSGFFHGLWVVVKWIFGIILVCLLMWLTYWFIFEKRW